MTAEGVRTRTIFLGSGRFGLPVLALLADHPSIDLIGVITAPPRLAGRRAQPGSTPIHRATPAGVPVLTPARLRSPDALATIAALDPDLAVLADYGQIVPASILDLRLGALNVHPSLLPRHRGATPLPAAILAGDEVTGVTLFRMDAGLDTGPLIADRRIRIDGSDTAMSLHARLSALAADLLADSLDPWIRGEIEAHPQPDVGATLTRPLRREDGRLNPGRPAVELDRMIRAFEPWPGTFIETDGGRVLVWRAHPVDAEMGDSPGRIVAHGDGIALTTADRRLVFDEVQPAGGRRMTGELFRRGRPAGVGSHVVVGR